MTAMILPSHHHLEDGTASRLSLHSSHSYYVVPSSHCTSVLPGAITVCARAQTASPAF